MNAMRLTKKILLLPHMVLLCITCAFGEPPNDGKKIQVVPVRAAGLTAEQSRKVLQTFIAHDPAVGLFAKVFPTAPSQTFQNKDRVGILITVRVDDRYLVSLNYNVLFSADYTKVEQSQLVNFSAFDLSLLTKDGTSLKPTPIKLSEMEHLCANPSEFLKNLLDSSSTKSVR